MAPSEIQIDDPSTVIDHGPPSSIPLCVDMDGTLVKTNTLVEALLALILARPWLVFLLPIWLMRGQAQLWHRLIQYVSLNVAVFPYRSEVLEYLKIEKRAGRELILISGAHRTVVEKVAGHLGFFDHFWGSDESVHLVGRAKLSAIARHYGNKSFDYLGDSRADLHIWNECRHAVIASDDKSLIRKLKWSAESVEQIKLTGRSPARAAFAALRPHQWSKNLLLFVAIFLGHKFNNLPLLLTAIEGFVAFSLCSSAVYIVNDLTDLEADRLHDKKRHRPFAAGDLSVRTGLLMAALLVIGALTLALNISLGFATVLSGYLGMALLYTFCLKEKLLIDVFALAGFYTIRVWAGGVCTGIVISHWALAYFMCFFLSLALAKRYSELAATAAQKVGPLNRRGYGPGDRQFILSLGCSSALMSVLVVALYINSPDVSRYYSRPSLLWLACPALAYWSSRIWLIASRGALDEDPVLFTVKDKVSYLVGAIIVVTVLLSI